MPPTLLEEYEDLRTKALAITDLAVKEDRQLTDDEAKQLDEYVEQATGKKAEHTKQAEATALVEKAKGLEALKPTPAKTNGGGGEKTADHRSVGQRFTESDNFKALLEAYPGGLPEKGDVRMPPVMIGSARDRGSKALVYVGDNTTQAGSTIPGVPQDYRGVIQSWFPDITVFSVITRSSTSSELVEYVREDLAARVNAAAPVPEAKATSGAGYTAAAKPESAVAWVRVATPVRTIATWVPITTKALADVPQMRSMVDAYLLRFLDEAMANQVVNGDGTGENFSGLVNEASAGAASVGFAGLREALAAVQDVADPNAWLMNPADIAAIDTQTDGNDRFFGNGPFSIGPRSLWGLPIVSVRQLPAGTVLVGDFTQAVLYDREQASVQIGTINDQFTHNMRTLLAEERAAFGVLRPEAIAKTALTWV